MDLAAWCDALERDGAGVLQLRGTSMTPTLRDGDVVSVRRGPGRWGDVVLVLHDGGFLCHRRVGPGLFKGDGRAAFDRPRGARVVGRVVSRLSGDRFVPLSPLGPLWSLLRWMAR